MQLILFNRCHAFVLAKSFAECKLVEWQSLDGLAVVQVKYLDLLVVIDSSVTFFFLLSFPLVKLFQVLLCKLVVLAVKDLVVLIWTPSLGIGW